MQRDEDQGISVLSDRRGAVMVLSLEARGLNGAAPYAAGELAAALDAAAADWSVHALVIEALDPPDAPVPPAALTAESGAALARLCLRIEALPKPVVMVVHGQLAGAGVELALSTQFRVALAGASFALPQIRMGLLPCAGGTQRLPRLIGARRALAMMRDGAAVTAPDAAVWGLVDLMVEDQALEAGLAAATEMTLRDWTRLRTSARVIADAAGHIAAVAEYRRKPPVLPAEARIVDCVEAALVLPMAQGLLFERTAFEDLLGSDEVRGLGHAAFAEALAFAVPAFLADETLPDLQAIAIWGAGAGASDLAAQAVTAGFAVTLVDPGRARLVAALERVAMRLERDVAEGRSSPEAREANWARLIPTLLPEGLTDGGLIFCGADAGPLPDLALALPQIALGAAPPPAGVGLQAGSGPGQLAELSAWPDAPVAVQRLGYGFARRLGWRVVLAGAGGQIERRLLEALAATIAEEERLGASHWAIAGALEAFGIGSEDEAGKSAPQNAGTGVVAACLAALANAGGRMLSEGVALRPADVDAVAIQSGLFPRWQGGPMYWAERRGALVLRAELRRRAEVAPAIFTPAAFFDDVIAQGLHIADLNTADDTITSG